MFKFNLITGPPFFAGLFNGMNKRADPKFQHDTWAHYKLLGIGMGMSVAHSLNQYCDQHYPNMKSSFKTHLIAGGLMGGFLASGSAYCLGLLLTKIPSKKAFE